MTGLTFVRVASVSPDSRCPSTHQAAPLTIFQTRSKIPLEGAARYAGLLLAPAEGFGLQPRPFFALRAKKGFLCLFWPNFSHFWWSVVTSVNVSSNLSNFKHPSHLYSIFIKKWWALMFVFLRINIYWMCSLELLTKDWNISKSEGFFSVLLL